MYPTAGSNVLVVEDEFAIAVDLVDALEAVGCRAVGPIDNLVDAQRIVATGEVIDLAILDLNLYRTKVYPLAEMLWERRIPFIFLTGQDGEVVPSRFCSVPMCMKPMKASAVVTDAFAFADMVRERGREFGFGATGDHPPSL